MDRIGARHEDEGARPVLLLAGIAPGLLQAVQQQPNIQVRHAVADEQHRAAERVGAEFYIERRIETQAREIVSFSNDQRCIVLEVAVEVDNLRDIALCTRNIACPEH